MPYYLRKEPTEVVIPEIRKTDGTVIPERKRMTDDRAVYKAREFSRFYRGPFMGLSGKYQGMKVYTCKTLKTILGEWFDVYNENGKVDIEEVQSCGMA